ncbi:hypothetical protein J4205_03055, partial [Candidatus Pacearchaeota archaeon]|nr:hypothetical protein [Candidatus Pacearchaeota archaeon]
MGRTSIARASIEKLRKTIDVSKNNKKILIKYLEDVKNKYVNGEIKYYEYENLLKENLDGRTIPEWFEYYDNTIKTSEKKIREAEKKLTVKKVLTIFLSLLIISFLFLIMFYNGLTFTAFIIKEQPQVYTQTINFQTAESINYEWNPEYAGILNSLKLSGSVEGNGDVKIYLDDLLIFSSNQESKKGITGSAVENIGKNKGNSILKSITGFFKSSFSKITGKTIEETGDVTQEEKETAESSKSQESQHSSSEDKSEEASQQDNGPSQESGKLPASDIEKTESVETEIAKETKLEETQELGETTGQENIGDQNNSEEKVEGNETKINEEQQNKTKEDEAEKNITEETKSDGEIKDKQKEVNEAEKNIINFENACEKTCTLSGLNLNKSSYTLRIEISNAKLNLDKIIYELVPGETSENTTETTENITETNETGQIPGVPENITEIGENITEQNVTNIANITEQNVTNTSQAPLLIQEIPNLEIEKNSFAIIEIEKYFSNAEQYFILQNQNISTTTFDRIVKLQPDKDFTGERKIKIIIKNEFGQAESNLFTLKISEEVNAPALIKNISDIEIQKNSFAEINLSEYFSNADNYFMLQVEGIKTTSINNIIRIIPEENFTGLRDGKIIAFNEFGGIESNTFNIAISENISQINLGINITNISIETRQYKAVINAPVKWIKKINASDINSMQNLTIELPKQAENISIKTGEEVELAISELENYESTIENTERKNLLSGAITGNVALDISESNGILTRFFKWIKKFTITGNVIQEAELQGSIVETIESKIIDIGDIAVQTQETEVAVEYYTPGPYSIEENLTNGKRVTVSSTDEENYTNILAFSEIPESFNVDKKAQIKIYWNEEKTYVNFTAYDLDENGKLDYVEWAVPHLSNQTFEIIIEITKAEHLDENRNFISDIYNETKALDDIWSEEIPENHYVRATFEANLTNKNDITIYPRITSGSPKIEIYEFDKNEKIAEFSSIIDNQYNKILLTNLQNSQDVFDLKIIGGTIQLDHIIDPLPLLTELNITGAMELCGEISNYSNIFISPTGKVNICAKNATGGTGFVNISLGLAGNFTIASGGYIAGEGKGARGGADGGTNGIQGENGTEFGTGLASTLANGGGGGGGSRTTAAGTSGGGGGGFGGSGGTGGNHTGTGGGNKGLGGNMYGTATNNVILYAGSAGGGDAGDGTGSTGIGAPGGAGLRVNASSGVISIQGTINVSGNKGNNGDGTDDSGGGGGSGGHIILIAKTLILNSGVVNASGGRGGNAPTGTDSCGGGGGGGGRIVYTYNTLADALLKNFTLGGMAGTGLHTDCNAITDLGNSTYGNNGTVSYVSSTFPSDVYTPTVLLQVPANNSLTSISQVWFSIGLLDDVNVSNGTLYIYNTTDGAVDKLIGTNFTGLGNNSITANISYNLNYTGIFYWNFLAFDSLSNKAFNETNFTLNYSTPANTAPVIIRIFNNSQIGGALNEGPSNTIFIVNFTATDENGNANLNSETATINFTKTGEDTRYNQTCKQYEADGNFANYTCEVQMWWWDGDGAWTINATINDLSAEKATNDTQTFSVALTTGFVLGPGNLTFTGVFGAATNITSNEVVILNNTGNKDIAQTAISINATKLAG